MMRRSGEAAVDVEWRLLVSPDGASGAENMAIDLSLLDDAAESGIATLRLYSWDPPCLSLGRNEPESHYDPARIEDLAIDVVRRPTGGSAVWHEHEVTYAVAAPIATFGSLREAYCGIHERIAAALRGLGADVSLAPRSPPAYPPTRLPACFESAAGGEILVRGRKLVGSAQVRQRDAFLQHGSILLAGTQEMIRAASFQQSDVRRQTSDVSGATNLATVLGRPITFQEVADAVVRAFSDRLTAASSDRPAAAFPDHPPPSSTVDLSRTWRR